MQFPVWALIEMDENCHTTAKVHYPRPAEGEVGYRIRRDDFDEWIEFACQWLASIPGGEFHVAIPNELLRPIDD
jgi:hypothetical protein